MIGRKREAIKRDFRNSHRVSFPAPTLRGFPAASFTPLALETKRRERPLREITLGEQMGLRHLMVRESTP